MLSDAGYKDGFDTQIVANTDKTIEATALQSALKDLNINASTNLVADDATIRAEGKEPGVYLGLWGAKLDQTTNFTAHLAPNGLLAKLANWTDEADEIVNKIATATTREDKVKAMQDYVTYLCFDQCFMVPLYCTASKNYVQDNIHGLAESVQYNHTAFEKIWIG